MLELGVFGFGRFGSKYVAELELLDDVNIKFVVTKSGIRPNSIQIPIPFFSIKNFEWESLIGLDGCIIVVSGSHNWKLAHKALAYCPVFVEKPVFCRPEDVEGLVRRSRDTRRLLYPAQLFRFHSLSGDLADLLNRHVLAGTKYYFKSVFSVSDEIDLASISAELNHFVDLFFWLTNAQVKKYTRVVTSDGELTIFVDCLDGSRAEFIFAAGRCRPQRTVDICDPEGVQHRFDFAASVIEQVTVSGDVNKIFKSYGPGAMLRCLKDFFSKLTCFSTDYQFGVFETVSRVCAMPSRDLSGSFDAVSLRGKKTVVVVGAGIFGCCAAIEIVRNIKGVRVCIVEKELNIIGGATELNQLRHHKGFHYPLSFETRKEINFSEELFEKKFGDALIRVPSYYFTSSSGREIPWRRYKAALDEADLSYEEVDITAFSVKGVSNGVLTDESIYCVRTLRDLLAHELKEAGVEVYFGSEAVSCEMTKASTGGVIRLNNELGEPSYLQFDAVVNAAYGAFDSINKMLGIDDPSGKYELTQLLEFKLDHSPACYTVIDGPFVSLTASSLERSFRLSHKDLSMLSRAKFSQSHLLRKNLSENTLEENGMRILDAASKYFPIVEGVQEFRSIVCRKAIKTGYSDVWERPSFTRAYGFGRYAVLGGKILTAPAQAEELSRLIASEL